MKIKFVLLLCITSVILFTAKAQVFSTSDSNTIFRSQDGKVLNREELQEQVKGKFSIRKEYVDGKQVITIIPSSDDEAAKRSVALDAFRRDLIGQQLPAFKIPGYDYRVWDSDQLRGRVMVMNFWFTACGPCIKEMPLLNALTADYKYKNVVFLALAPESRGLIKRFLKKNSFKYNIVPAASKYIQQLQVENFPTHLLIDKHGVIRQVFIGYEEGIKDKLQAEIDKLLKERW
jgi:peroxiredoxin